MSDLHGDNEHVNKFLVEKLTPYQQFKIANGSYQNQVCLVSSVQDVLAAWPK